MKDREIYYTIPIGEVKCIWMSSGLVEFKLCDKNYECDSCEFYNQIRKIHETEINEANNYTLFGDTPQKMKEKFISFINGYTIKDDLLYSQYHIWIDSCDLNCVSIGIDSFISRLLPNHFKLIFPISSNFIKQGHPMLWLTTSESTFTFRSPLSGNIKEINSELNEVPEHILLSPYEKGWLFRIKPTNFESEKKSLLGPKEASNLFENQSKKIENKITEVIENYSSEIGSTMMDGGRVITDLYDLLGPKKYNEIIQKLI